MCGVGVLENPGRQAGSGVLAHRLERPVHRVESQDRTGVPPPLRAPDHRLASQVDPQRLASQIERRYGIDPRTAGTDDLEHAGDMRALANSERVREREHDEAARDAGARSVAAERDDEIGAGIVMSGAAQDAAPERSAELGSAAAHGHAANALDVDADGVTYDSDARRSALAERAAQGRSRARRRQGSRRCGQRQRQAQPAGDVGLEPGGREVPHAASCRVARRGHHTLTAYGRLKLGIAESSRECST
jgi:hypothetical protein